MKIESSESYFDDHDGNTIWTIVKKDPRTNRWVFLAQVYWGGEDDEFKSFPSQLSYGTQPEAKIESSVAREVVDRCWKARRGLTPN
jgi:hypothetical protein